MVNTIQKAFICAAFVSVLFLQHPNFLGDLQRLVQTANFGSAGPPTLTNTLPILAFLYVIFVVVKKVRRYELARKTAGGIGLRLHEVKTLGWIVIEVVPDGAGDLNGVRTGDCITHVDGISVSLLKSFFVIRGPVGSSVALRVKRGIPGIEDLVAQILEKGSVDVLPEFHHPISESASETTEDPVEERILTLERKDMRRVSQENEKKKDD